MPPAPQDRPLPALREETIDRLIVNYGHGKISLEAFERRLDEALDAQSHDQLVALTADLELAVDAEYAARKRSELGVDGARVAPAGSGVSREPELMVNIFGGSNRRGAWTVPPEIKMINVFGGAELDFSAAEFAAPTTRISVFCLFGGATIYVAENINVVARAHCLFGGIDNRAPSNNGAAAPTIVIEGLVIFGGASIKIRKSMKDRWLELAEQFKSAFASMHHRY
jgi:hypothetical protein